MDTYTDRIYKTIGSTLEDKHGNDYLGIALINKLIEVQIEVLLKEYYKLCNNHLFWELEDYNHRKARLDDLNQKRKQFNVLLKELIPKSATKKKTKHALVLINKLPEAFVLMVEFKKNQIESLYNQHRDKYYKMNYNDAIDKILFNEYNLYEDQIDHRSKTTVAISLLAHQMNVSFDSLYAKYTHIGQKRRSEILADNT